MGALTNKPMAFNSRNWEYNSQIIDDLTDLLTPRIRVDQFSGKIYRILPTVEWISNKVRFLYLGLRNQRIISPLFTYKFFINLELKNKKIIFTRLLILTNRLENSFFFLKKKLNNFRKKTIRLVLGSVFDANISFFDVFEKNNTKINKYSEFSGNLNPESFYFEETNYLLFGVNPRMESPLLNLKMKESQKEIYSVGNFSLQSKVIDNNNYSLVKGIQGKLLSDTRAFFGISTLEASKNYLGKKTIIAPLYYLNNLVNHQFFENRKLIKNNDDVSIYISNQNLIESQVETAIIIATHFEKLKGNDKTVRLPIAGYLETNINYLNNSLNFNKINSVKPSFNLSDLIFAFTLFTKKGLKLKIGKRNNFSSKKKLFNGLIANMVPNFLVRDPLTRANQLFNKI